ncbi:MAG: hypothetical protein WBB73_09530 [Candidatus Aminicenantaceae bacterium]
MKRSISKISFALAAWAALMLIFAPVAPVLAQTGDAKNTYAELLGDYEFDLADLGMGVVVINVYVEGDSLWVWPETSSEPAEMTPVEGEKFKFFIEDDEEGHYDVIFLKDEDGKYTKCQVVNEGMGLDSTGTKIKK